MFGFGKVLIVTASDLAIALSGGSHLSGNGLQAGDFAADFWDARNVWRVVLGMLSREAIVRTDLP